MSIEMVKGYRMPPGANGEMDYAGFAGYGRPVRRYGNVIIPSDSDRYAVEQVRKRIEAGVKAESDPLKVLAATATRTPTERAPDEVVIVTQRSVAPSPSNSHSPGKLIAAGVLAYLLYRAMR